MMVILAIETNGNEYHRKPLKLRIKTKHLWKHPRHLAASKRRATRQAYRLALSGRVSVWNPAEPAPWASIL